MSAVLETPVATPIHTAHRSLADLLRDLGDIPLERIRMIPPPGTATLADLDEANESPLRTAVCELVDATLVEKPVGFSESEAAGELLGEVRDWNKGLKLGFFTSGDAVVQLSPEKGRGPDFAFYLYERFPERKRPPGRIPAMFPDFAVEVLSKSNTKKEMARKRREYFAAGTRLVWEVDLKKQTVAVYREPEQGQVFGIDDTLSGEDVLPGFTISIRKWLDGLTPE